MSLRICYCYGYDEEAIRADVCANTAVRGFGSAFSPQSKKAPVVARKRTRKGADAWRTFTGS